MNKPVSNWRDYLFIRMDEAAAVLGLSRAALYSMAQNGRISLKSLSGRTLVPVADVIRLESEAKPWAASSKTRSATEARIAAAAKRKL